MKGALKQDLLHEGYDEVIISNMRNHSAIHRAVKSGKLRKLEHFKKFCSWVHCQNTT
ncbi:MAG: hypothetical protein ACOYK6_04135 [Chthoniobacterales bacterium]